MIKVLQRSRARVFVGALLAAVIFAACGTGSGTPPPVATATPANATPVPSATPKPVLSATPTASPNPLPTPTPQGKMLPAPTGVEAHATLVSGEINVTWDVMPGATGYKVYRATISALEGTTPVGTTTSTTYHDAGLTGGPPPVYYYRVSAVYPGGISQQSIETATATPLPRFPGNGNVAGVAIPGGWVYYCKDALLNGYDWFDFLNGWFPQVMTPQPGAITTTPVDMAYANNGTMQFSNVAVPASGLYNLDFRYAFGPGLFPDVFDRQMGLKVNGTVITSTMRFTRTGDFGIYQDANIQVTLNTGPNTMVLFAVSDHGVSRVDEITVTPAKGSAPSGPANLTGAAAAGRVALSWSAASGAAGYNVYRGQVADGESLTPIATLGAGSTSYTDVGLTNGTVYFYNVAATNAFGISPNSNEITVAAH